MALHPGGLLVHAAVVVVVVTRVRKVRVGSGAGDGGRACLDACVVVLGPFSGGAARHHPGFAPLVTLDEPAQEMVQRYCIGQYILVYLPNGEKQFNFCQEAFFFFFVLLCFSVTFVSAIRIQSKMKFHSSMPIRKSEKDLSAALGIFTTWLLLPTLSN